MYAIRSYYEYNYIDNNTVHNTDADTFLRMIYEEYGNESIEMFLVDFPYRNNFV